MFYTAFAILQRIGREVIDVKPALAQGVLIGFARFDRDDPVRETETKSRKLPAAQPISAITLSRRVMGLTTFRRSSCRGSWAA